VRKPGGDHERLSFAEQQAVATPLSAEDARLFATATQ